jgi:hypothetical protein
VDDVSGNQLLGFELLQCTIANHLCDVGGIFLKSCNCFFGAAFLGYTDDSIEDKDGEDLP